MATAVGTHEPRYTRDVSPQPKRRQEAAGDEDAGSARELRVEDAGSDGSSSNDDDGSDSHDDALDQPPQLSQN